MVDLLQEEMLITLFFQPEINVTQGRVYSTPGSNVTLGCLITGNIKFVILIPWELYKSICLYGLMV